MAAAKTKKKETVVKLDIHEIAKKLGLPEFSNFEENNIEYISEAGGYASSEVWENARQANPDLVEAEEGQTAVDADRAREKAEQRAGDELYRNWSNAVERAADEIWGFHHLYVNETAKGGYQVLPKAGKDWHDVARQIAITINGVGLTDVPAEDYARNPKKFVLEHLGSMQMQPEVYGTVSAQRIYEGSFR